MYEFLKYFYYTTINDKEIEIYRIVNSYSKQVVRLECFKNAALEPPIFMKGQVRTLWDELTEVFSYCQKNATTASEKVGFDKKGENIMESNLKVLYPEIVKLIKKHVDREVRDVVALSNDPQEVCLRYKSLDDLDISKQTPFLDYFCSGFSKSDEIRFKLYLASIFDSNNHNKQLLLVYDRIGDSGKSSFINALQEYVGLKICESPSEENLNSRFGLANLYKKKLLSISENKNANILFGKMMMSILGGDLICAEIKGIQEAQQFYPECKVIIASNDPILTSGNNQHNTRLVVCDIQEDRRIPEPSNFRNEDGSYFYGGLEMRNLYVEEMPYFIDSCISLYNEYNRPAKTIYVEGQTELDMFLTDQNQIYRDIFNKYFIYRDKLVKAKDGLPNSTFSFLKKEILKELKSNGITYNPSTTQLKSELKIETKILDGAHYLTNIQLKDDYDYINDEIVLAKFNSSKINKNEI